MSSIPLVDLGRSTRSIRKEIDRAIDEVLGSNSFILGQHVSEFERAFARFCGAEYCVGVASGLDALKLALKSIGVGPGDEVVTAANTFIATALAISDCGATPVLVDCDPLYHTIDPEKMAEAISPRTKAIIPVHLYGQPADMDAIMKLTRAKGIQVIEDACQSHGARIGSQHAGSIGDVGCFSFYPGKNLGAFGDGGAVVTRDKRVAEGIGLLRNYGQREKYIHDVLGLNSRLDTIQAAVLGVKLRHLSEWNAQRRRLADLYTRALSGVEGITLPRERVPSSHVYHLYVVEVDRRDRVIEVMKERGISCGIHYPVPIHLQKAYAHLGYRVGSFPVTEASSKRVLSLPMFPELTEEEVGLIVGALRDAVRSLVRS